MSVGRAEAGAARAPWAAWAGALFTVALLAFAALVFFGMGPRFEDAAWYEPTGWLAYDLDQSDLYPLADELGYALALFGGVALLLLVAIFATTRSAVARFLGLFSLVAVACFLYYGIDASFVWEFFQWRWSGSMLLFAATVAAVLTSPLLAESWLRLPVWARVAVYLPIALLVLVYERNVTGTDQSLRFALSPWPVVQIFGIELVGTCVGALVLGVGLGLLALRRAPAGGAALAAGLLGVVAAAGLPVAALWLASEQNLLPARVGGTGLGVLAAVGATCFVVAWARGARAGVLAARSAHWLAAGALVLVPIVAGQLWARWDYATTREDHAQRVIDALAAYFEREAVYPDELEALVEEDLLDEVPSPRVGFALLHDQEFVYQSFGTSYLLEFSAPRWIQCAYNPPYPDEYEDEEEAEAADAEGEALGAGAWSCPSKPPELW